MEVKEDDEDFLNAVDYMFKGLEQRKPNCFAVRQYKKYKLAAGVRFQYDYAQGDLFLSEERVVLVLKNGKTVINTGAMGSPTDDNQFMQYTYQWLVPVNLDEVDHLEIGTAQIALP